MALQSRQALRSRMKSVKSTRKITGAMEMMSSAKLFRFRNKMEANREYAKRLQETVNEIVSENPDIETLYTAENKATETVTIVFGSDMGLCGAYNANILNAVKKYCDKNAFLWVIGSTLYKPLKEMPFRLLNEESISSDALDFSSLKVILAKCVSLFENKQVGKVQVLYTRFVNTMKFEPVVDQLLPCHIETTKQETKEMKVETLFEPNAEDILNQLIPMMLMDVVYSDWMESITSEQGSRRVAMKTASDNADDLLSSLRLAYNKARQTAITQEITEIVSGSNAV